MRRYGWKAMGTLALAGCLCLGATSATPAAASSSVQQRIDEAAKAKKDNLAKLNEAKEQRKSVLADKEVLDGEIEILETELAEIDSIIAEADANIAQKESEIAQYETQIESQDLLFRKRLRAVDEISASNYVDVLFKAKSFSDFLARLETVKEIAESDQAVIGQMITLKNGVETSKQELENSRQEQMEARNLVDGKKSELDEKRSQKEAMLDELENDMERYEAAYNEAEAAEKELKSQLSGMLSKSSQSSSGGGSYTGGGGGSGELMWPLPSSRYITSPFGYRLHPVLGTTKYHSGLDIAESTGAPVYAAADGVVTLAGSNGGYGYCIVIDHGNGLATLYGHNSALLVSTGQRVTKGQQISRVGSTGMTTGPHLHFEVLKNGSAVNPYNYVD